MEDLRRLVEELEHAENELTNVYWEIRDERGFASTAKKLDTILGKLYNLKNELIDKERKNESQ